MADRPIIFPMAKSGFCETYGHFKNNVSLCNVVALEAGKAGTAMDNFQSIFCSGYLSKGGIIKPKIQRLSPIDSLEVVV